MAYAGLKLGDRISFFSFAAKPQALTPAYMHIHDFPALQRAASLIDYAPVESNFTLALSTLSAELNRRSLIILFTEFTDATSAAVRALRADARARVRFGPPERVGPLGLAIPFTCVDAATAQR